MVDRITIGGREFLEELRVEVEEGAQDEGLQTLVGMIDTLAETIVPNTPVDKDGLYGHPGKARGSWHILTAAGRQLSTPGLDTDGSATIRKIKSGIRSLTEVEDVIFDSPEELVPYMNRLENGWSDQARGFIAAGIATTEARYP